MEDYACEGTLRFYGLHPNENTTQCGVELDKPLGKNNGILHGHEFFVCAEKHGVFCSPDKITSLESDGLIASNDSDSRYGFAETEFSRYSERQRPARAQSEITEPIHNSIVENKSEDFSNELYGNAGAETVDNNSSTAGFREGICTSRSFTFRCLKVLFERNTESTIDLS